MVRGLLPPSIGTRSKWIGVSFVLCVLFLGAFVVLFTAPGDAAEAQSTSGFSCTIFASPFEGPTVLVTGTITGGNPPYSWTLYFGDGTSTSGSGPNISEYHYYAKAGNYTVTMDAVAFEVDGAQEKTSCTATVTVLQTFTFGAQEQIGLSDTASVPMINLNENANLSDQMAKGRALNETLTLGDNATVPGVFADETVTATDRVTSVSQNGGSEPASLSDQVSASLVSSEKATVPPGRGLLANLGLDILIGAAGISIGAVVVWRVILPRRR